MGLTLRATLQRRIMFDLVFTADVPARCCAAADPGGAGEASSPLASPARLWGLTPHRTPGRRPANNAPHMLTGDKSRNPYNPETSEKTVKYFVRMWRIRPAGLRPRKTSDN